MDTHRDSPVVVVLDDYGDVVSSLGLAATFPQVRWRAVREHLEGPELTTALSAASAVVLTQGRTQFPACLFDQLPALRLLVTTGMSNPAIDLDAATARGVTVCGTTAPPACGGNYAAELAWALILCLARSIPGEVQGLRDGGWQHTVGSDLSGATLGVVGLGRVGSAMPPVGRAFGMEVIAWSDRLSEDQAAAAGARLVTKQELFSGADFITLHLALAASTAGTVGEPELRAMKDSAYLVNTSRSRLVDTSALLRALHEGWIAGAAIDVFDTEPLPADSPLRSAPRLIATPHLGYATHRTLMHWYTDAAEDVLAWRQGTPLRVING